MDGSKPAREAHHRNLRHEQVTAVNGEAADSLTSLEQVRRLVQLIDESDVSELELKQPGEGMRLVLRKIPAQAGSGISSPGAAAAPPSLDGEQLPSPAQVEMRIFVSAHLVGIFHRWLKPKGGALVAAGDNVRVGQLIATIESLNIINEVESPVVGRVIEILVQEGQPVEYGQRLIAIEPAGDEEEA